MKNPLRGASRVLCEEGCEQLGSRGPQTPSVGRAGSEGTPTPWLAIIFLSPQDACFQVIKMQAGFTSTEDGAPGRMLGCGSPGPRCVHRRCGSKQRSRGAEYLCLRLATHRGDGPGRSVLCSRNPRCTESSRKALRQQTSADPSSERGLANCGHSLLLSIKFYWAAAMLVC